jgi:hypothetical protein
VVCYLFPRAVPPDKGIRRQNRSCAVFAVIHGVIGTFVCGDRRVAVDPYVEVGDNFTVGLVVFHFRQNRLRSSDRWTAVKPRPPAESKPL